MFKTFKKWLASDGTPHIKSLPSRETLEEQDARMVGEPVTSFIASLAREPKRYKIERVLTLKEFPKYTHYHWMNSGSAGTWKFTDTKTGLTLGAYVHEEGRVWAVYGLPFDLNHWELKAIYMAFYNSRHKAEERKERMRQSARERARKFKEELEKVDRLAFAKQFQEG